jgi:hypothetical protein
VIIQNFDYNDYVIGPLKRYQIVSDSALSSMVRSTCIHTEFIVRSIRKENGEFISNWEERLRQIKNIKLKYSKDYSKDDDGLVYSMNDYFN